MDHEVRWKRPALLTCEHQNRPRFIKAIVCNEACGIFVASLDVNENHRARQPFTCRYEDAIADESVG